jgi:hypothetical protein
MEKIKNNEEFRSKLIEELNQCRKDPKKYSEKVRSYIKYFRGRILSLPNMIGLMTNEGADAFIEAAEFLENKNPISKLKYSPGLTHIAHDYMNEIQKFDDISKAKKVNLTSIINKYGVYYGDEIKQLIDFGALIPELIVINIIVNDGDKDREIRNVFFNENFCDVGVSTGEHLTYNKCTVILFCNKFVSVNDDSFEKCKKEIEEINMKKSELIKKEEDFSDDDFNLPKGVERINKEERIIRENGVKRKMIKITSYNIDGSKDVKIYKDVM